MAYIEKRGDKRWRARYRGPDGREHSKTFDRKGDAERFLTTVEAAKLEGRWTDPSHGKTTFSKLARDVMDSKLNIRRATRAKYESLLRVHLVPRFGDLPVSRIGRPDVQEFVKRMSESGYSPATVSECYSLLGSILGEAVEEGYLSQSPCRRIGLPHSEKSEKRFLSAEQIETLVEAFPEENRALIYTAAYLGLRWGEAAGLKRQPLNLLRQEIRIVGTIERAAGVYRYVEDTKSVASRRTIKLPPFLVEILAAHLETATVAEFVFPAAEGGFLRYDNFRRRVWQPAVERAGLGHLTFHELRHTAAALLIDQGADPLLIQRRLGHKDIRTTYRHYGHLFPNREESLNEALEKLHREAAAASPRPEVIEVDFPEKRKGASTRENGGGRYWDRTSDLFGVNEDRTKRPTCSFLHFRRSKALFGGTEMDTVGRLFPVLAARLLHADSQPPRKSPSNLSHPVAPRCRRSRLSLS